MDPPSLRTRGHRFSVTAAVITPDARYVFTSAKDGNIIKHDLNSGKLVHTFHKQRPPSSKGKGKGKAKASDVQEAQGHTDEVWAMAVSADGKYLASGGKDRRVGVWDVEKNVWVRGFGGHRDSISVRPFHRLLSSELTIAAGPHLPQSAPERVDLYPAIHRVVRPDAQAVRPGLDGLRRDALRAPGACAVYRRAAR